MKSFKYIFAGLALLLATTTANAQLAGKNVLLIHGFNPGHILNPPSDKGYADAQKSWSDFEPSLRDPGTSRILYWPSNYRMSGKDGVAALVSAQLKPILNSGFCDDQCIIITHSTGDLVARYLLAYKNSLLGSSLAKRFKVAAVIDIAGAGGGTELANVAVDVIKGVNTSSDILKGLLKFAGFKFEFGMNPGVLVDLQPAVARNTALNSVASVPRLRIAGAGNEAYGFITHGIIKGKDDSVVPLHSSCGAASNGDYDSCVRDLRIDGRITRVSKAPYLSQLYDYHYPVIMSKGAAHNQMNKSKTGNDMTLALSGVGKYNQSRAKTIDVDVEYKNVRVWWDWFRKYRFISGAKDKSMGRVIVDSFE